MEEMGKLTALLGLILLMFGLLFWPGSKIPFLGRLPGDILIKRERFTFFFPLVTCITLSIVLTIVLNLFIKH
jgi:hypothetical protein